MFSVFEILASFIYPIIFFLCMWLTIIIILVCMHFLSFFLLSRIFVPFLGFRKEPLPNKIPKQIEDKINELKKTANSREEYTKAAFLFLLKRYKSLWFFTLIRMNVLFFRDLEKIYNQKGFLPCNSHNHLLRIFLVKSGYYNDNQIEIRHCFLNFGIHQYLRIDDDGKTFDLDLWGYNVGVPIGRHAVFFKSASLLTDVVEVIRILKKSKKKTKNS